jgi:hypothetical protein
MVALAHKAAAEDRPQDANSCALIRNGLAAERPRRGMGLIGALAKLLPKQLGRDAAHSEVSTIWGKQRQLLVCLKSGEASRFLSTPSGMAGGGCTGLRPERDAVGHIEAKPTPEPRRH